MKQAKGNGSRRDAAAGGMAAGEIGSTGTLSAEAKRLQDIATAAYFRAEARGFGPGHELDDWLAAEAALSAAAARPRRGAPGGLSPP